MHGQQDIKIYNRGTVSLLRGTSWIFKHNSVYLLCTKYQFSNMHVCTTHKSRPFCATRKISAASSEVQADTLKKKPRRKIFKK